MWELMNLQMRTARMMAEAQTVIAMRMLGLAGILPAAKGENRRMIAEKQAAYANAGMAAAGAMMAGATPLQAWSAALSPIGRTTRANSRRLTRPRRR